jgi:hypothetical protein
MAALALVTGGSGCMAISAADNSRAVKDRHQVVAVNNRVYLIDTRTGEAREIDLKEAKPLKVNSMPETTSAGDH